MSLDLFLWSSFKLVCIQERSGYDIHTSCSDNRQLHGWNNGREWRVSIIRPFMCSRAHSGRSTNTTQHKHFSSVKWNVRHFHPVPFRLHPFLRTRNPITGTGRSLFFRSIIYGAWSHGIYLSSWKEDVFWCMTYAVRIVTGVDQIDDAGGTFVNICRQSGRKSMFSYSSQDLLVKTIDVVIKCNQLR